MLADQADQRQQSDLGVDVHRGGTEEQRKQCTDDRHRNTDHDHQRVAQAFELRRQHQEDDDQRKAEGDRELVAFLHILSGVGEIIVAVAGGQVPGLLLQEFDRLADRHPRHRHRLESRRIQLVEMRQRVGVGAGLDRDHGGQRDLLAAARGHVVAAERFRRQPKPARHLRDHLVGAPFQVEAVDIVAAE